MKTDALFYKLFRLSPKSLFRLVGMKLDGTYTFESITLKTTEKRFDGFMKRTDGEGPNVFVEIQGYNDNTIYWRGFREVCVWYEENDSDRPFVLVVLFTDEKYDPDNLMLTPKPPSRLVRKNLADCLKKLARKAGALTVLKPLGLSDIKKNREKLPELVPQWEEEIRSLVLSDHETRELTELLIYAIVQRFQKLTVLKNDTLLKILEKYAFKSAGYDDNSENRKTADFHIFGMKPLKKQCPNFQNTAKVSFLSTVREVEKMIQLTPIDQTVVGQELILMGKKETAKNLLAMGKLTPKEIAQVTGLTLKELRSLRKLGKR